MRRRIEEKREINLQGKLLENCKVYLRNFPEAKKFLFLSNEHLKNKLSIKDYIDTLIKSYEISRTSKSKNSINFDQKLEEKATEFIEFSRLSSKIYELEEEKLHRSTIYSIFLDNLNFYQDHNLFSENLMDNFKDSNLSLSFHFTKIMNQKINELNINEKEYIKSKCLDEIFTDQILCKLFIEGYLPDLSLDKIQLNLNRKAKSIASQIENSRYFYTSLESISKNVFIPNSWYS